MGAYTSTDPHGMLTSATRSGSGLHARVLTFVDGVWAILTTRFVLHLVIAFLGYYLAGKLGQATTNIRSGNLGPVWPASGIALAICLRYGYRVWPGLAAGSFLVALQSPVSAITAMGQATGATLAAVSGAFLLRRIAHFDPALSRLKDALALIVVGAFGATLISASIGMAALYATGAQPYSGLREAWLIYWLGDATGVLLVTPLVFTLPALRSMGTAKYVELAILLTLLTGACALVFGDLALVPIRLHVLAFAVLPFVIWAAIGFGIAGASLSIVVVAALATVLTALGSGPFSTGTPFANAALLDVLFAVLAASGLPLAAVSTERQRVESEREELIRARTSEEALADVSRRLIEAQERERNRIARELHDDICQRLSLLAITLTARGERDLHEQAAEITADLQALSHRLHSSRLELLGIAGAMRHFCEEFADQQKARVDFDAADLPARLPSEVSLSLFRILQEALQNAAKHSGTQHFDVQLWGAQDQVHLIVKDSGKGFDLAAAKAGRGIGLVSMEERIRLVNGVLLIESQPQQGTSIRASVRV
jgi:signal transduction histidine kinase